MEARYDGRRQMKPDNQSHPRFAGLPAARLVLPVAIVALLGAAWASGLLDKISLSTIIAHRETLAAQVAANRPLALCAYVLLYTVLVAISFPGASLLTLAGGYLFGGFIGGVATVIGATAGAVLIFLIARSSFGGTLERRAGNFAAKMAEGFRRDSFNYLLSLRLAPVFPFWVINIVPAILNMRLAPFALATFLGIIPGTFAIAYIGAGLGSVIESQERAQPGCAAAGTCHIDPGNLVTPQLVWALAGLAVLSLIPVVARRLAPGKRQA
ncbi:MAG TPA: TVP38/TMEM64 family protein, partial [Rhizobiaceae bacterium]|nr:TVP38/TMEM64 family protein [Rhizobiaceae bacterium]